MRVDWTDERTDEKNAFRFKEPIVSKENHKGAETSRRNARTLAQSATVHKIRGCRSSSRSTNRCFFGAGNGAYSGQRQETLPTRLFRRIAPKRVADK